MEIQELSREHLTELKQNYYCELHENVSYDELMRIDEFVSDDEIFNEYGGVEFVDDDFWN